MHKNNVKIKGFYSNFHFKYNWKQAGNNGRVIVCKDKKTKTNKTVYRFFLRYVYYGLQVPVRKTKMLKVPQYKQKVYQHLQW